MKHCDAPIVTALASLVLNWAGKSKQKNNNNNKKKNPKILTCEAKGEACDLNS